MGTVLVGLSHLFYQIVSLLLHLFVDLSFHNVYSTNCDLVTCWLCSTEPKCLHLDEVEHNHILRENKDI